MVFFTTRVPLNF